MAKLHDFNERMQETMCVEVCYASKQKTTIVELIVKCNSTIKEVIEISQILMAHPEVDIEVCKLGIFGQIKMPGYVVRQGDRVEIYRPLSADPMEARRRRSVKQLKIKPIF